MLKYFTLKNFRCFRDLTLGPFSRINLVAGMNNTGKTALLEAVHLYHYPSDCALPFTLSVLREADREEYFDEEAVSWVFHDRQPVHGLELSGKDEAGVSRRLNLWLVDPDRSRDEFPEIEMRLQKAFRDHFRDTQAPRLIMKSEAGSEVIWNGGMISGKGFAQLGSLLPWDNPCVLIGSGVPFSERDVKAFSELEATNRQDLILPSLQIVEPRLQRLSLLMLAGRPIIHGDVGLSRLVPTPFMGEGVRRLLSLLLAIGTMAGGTVLIDEIENGFHYSVIEKVWQAVADAARRANVQVFATTHSYECIEAAHAAFSAHGPYDFALHRLDRFDDEIEVTTYDQEALEGALKFHMEVR